MFRITKTFSLLFLAAVFSVTVADAQSLSVASGCGCAATEAGDCGCTSCINDCGKAGALFRGGQACDDCTGCDGYGGNDRGIMDRIKEFILPSDPCSYRSVFGGWSDMQDFNNTPGLSLFGETAANGRFNDGFILGTARGRYVNENLRFELENNWRNNTGNDLTLFNLPLFGVNQTIDAGGQFNMFSTMVNAVREFGNGRVRPYAGVGIGFGIQDGDFDVGANNFRLDDWAFAYQAILGMNLKQTERYDLFFEYRYYGNTDTQIELNGTEVDDFGFQSENVVFGFRFKR